MPPHPSTWDESTKPSAESNFSITARVPELNEAVADDIWSKRHPRNIKPNFDAGESSAFSFQLCQPCPLHDRDAVKARPANRENRSAIHDQDASVRPFSEIGSITTLAQKPDTVTSTPLRRWVEMERIGFKEHSQAYKQTELREASIIRKLSVAYGIGKLLHQCFGVQEPWSFCNFDNFVVHERKRNGVTYTDCDIGWEVVGIDMIKPSVSLKLHSDNFSRDSFFDITESHDSIKGRRVSLTIVNITDDESTTNFKDQESTSGLCRSFGVLLYFLFTGNSEVERRHQRCYDSDKSDHCYNEENNQEIMGRTSKKDTRDFYSGRDSFSTALSISGGRSSCHLSQMDESIQSVCSPPLYETGQPYSVSQLVENLLDSGSGLFCSDDSYLSLEDALSDIHLMLLEPDKYLMDFYHTSDFSCRLSTKSKLYGRTEEAGIITDAFCRVASTRESEAIVVGGYSGCGKTRLIESVTEAIAAARGYFVSQKFEETSTQSRLTVVLSAFNELCLVIAQGNTVSETKQIYQGLINEFGTSFYLLVRVIPNVIKLLPSRNTTHDWEGADIDINYLSLCFTLKRFLRVVSMSSTSRPIMLFLDDLQWADPTSLGLVNDILSDMKRSSSVLFVGSYRDNAIHPDHFLNKFIEKLLSCNVTLTRIHLDGIPEQDVNSFVSDSLFILPRLSKSLAEVIFRKTNGNPFFVQEFLRTLIDQKIVKYNLRVRRWMWDVDEINSMGITDNVLHLISTKMSGLSGDIQKALQVASCFGMKVEASILTSLSEDGEFCDLKSSLDEAVLEGFMDCDGTNYTFVHDQVRESAYAMIRIDERDRFHFEIGLALYRRSLDDNDDNEFLVSTLEQINYGVPSFVSCPNLRLSIAELNYKAGSAALKCFNFTSALTYLKTSVSLLPEESWTSDQYIFCLQCYYQLAKAAYPCGVIDVSRRCLDRIIENGKCLHDKLDAYILLIRILHHAQEELSQALTTCCDVLNLLGEYVPTSTVGESIAEEVDAVMNRIKSDFTSISGLLHMPVTECYYISRFAKFCIVNKVMCRYTPMALVAFSALLCHGFDTNSCREGYRIGTIGLSLLNQIDTKMQELPRVYMVYYSYAGVLFEPIQACEDMHRRGYEVGLQVGNICDAFFNLGNLIPRAIFGGSNLVCLKENIDFNLRLAEQHSHQNIAKRLGFYKETILLLIGDHATVTMNPGLTHDQSIVDAIPLHIVQLVLSSFFLGHLERVSYLMKKWDSLDSEMKKRVPLRGIHLAFYSGLAYAGLCRRKRSRTCLPNIKQSISVLAKASRLSQWNNKNKLYLLRAEYSSVQGKCEADIEYDVAIASAKSSKFVHEEALACELAGLHYKSKGNVEVARTLFERAKQCYVKWGSNVKSCQMDHELE